MRKKEKDANQFPSVRLLIALLVLPAQLLLLGGMEAGPWVDSNAMIDNTNITIN